MNFRDALLPLAVAVVAVSGCSVGGGSTTGSNDGKYHPPTNGQAISETDACNTLSTAIGSLRSNMQCVGTTPTCPSLVQGVSGVTCAQYDQGSIQGCVAYYGKATSCMDISTRVDNCEFAAISGSMGKGCP